MMQAGTTRIPRRIQVLAALLAMMGALTGVAKAQYALHLENPAVAALPPRLSLSGLQSMLRLFDVPVDAGRLKRAYSAYGKAIDSAVTESVQRAAPLTQTSSVSAGVSLSQSAARYLLLHQQKIRGICEQAERDLFTALAESLPEEEKAKLGSMQEVRGLGLETELLLRSASVMGYLSNLPGDLAAAVSGSPSVAALDKSDRERVATTLHAALERRRAAWMKAKPGISDAVAETLRLQFQDAESGREGHVGEVADVPAESRGTLWEAEFNLLDDLTKSATAAQSHAIRAAANAALRFRFTSNGDVVPLPKGRPRSPATVEELAAVILSSPGLTDSDRTKARVLLAEWIHADQDLQLRQVRQRASELVSGIPAGRDTSGAPSTRKELGISKLKQLHDALNIEWLVPNAQIPDSLTDRLALSERDARALEVPFVSRVVSVPDIPIAGRSQVSVGYLPQLPNVRALVATQSPDEAARMVLALVEADAQQEWQRSVEPQMSQLKHALHALAAAPSGARSVRREAWERIVAAQSERAAAWGSASAVSSKMLEDVRASLAGRHEQWRAELVAACLAADRASAIDGCSLLETLKGVTVCPDAAQAGIDMRGTSEEHALVCAAIEAQRESSTVRMEGIRRNVVALMADFEKAQATQYPPDADQADNSRKMQLATAFAEAMPPLRARANEIALDWRKANDELLADAGRLLPEALADRWRHGWRLAFVEPMRTAYVRYGLNYPSFGAPGARAAAQQEGSLDAWETWAALVLDETDRHAAAFSRGNDKDASIAARRRSLFLALALIPSLMDQVDASRLSSPQRTESETRQPTTRPQ